MAFQDRLSPSATKDRKKKNITARLLDGCSSYISKTLLFDNSFVLLLPFVEAIFGGFMQSTTQSLFPHRHYIPAVQKVSLNTSSKLYLLVCQWKPVPVL